MPTTIRARPKEGKKAPRGNRRENPIAGCPLTAALAAVGGKWKLIIVYWLGERPTHFAELRRLIPGISPKVLTEQLRQLVQDELVARHPTGAVPAPVEYELTTYGRTLLPIVQSVREWGRAHLEREGPEGGGAGRPAPGTGGTREGGSM